MNTFTVDELANEIRRVDGSHGLGAGALAEAIMPFLSSTEQPPRYVMSKDYDALHDLLCKGGEAFALVDYDWRDGSPTSRDVVRARRTMVGNISIGVRGIEYGDVSTSDAKRHGSERAAFLSECQRLNLEWVAVEQPNEQSKAPTYTGLLTMCLSRTDDEIVRLIKDLSKTVDKPKEQGVGLVPEHMSLVGCKVLCMCVEWEVMRLNFLGDWDIERRGTNEAGEPVIQGSSIPGRLLPPSHPAHVQFAPSTRENEQGGEPVAWMDNKGWTMSDREKRKLPPGHEKRWHRPLVHVTTAQVASSTREKALEEAGDAMFNAWLEELLSDGWEFSADYKLAKDRWIAAKQTK